MELYWGSGSPFAWRVMLALEIKKLPYTGLLLEFSKDDHQTPAYLALNPRGKVPTLKDGDVVIGESLAILAYLDRKSPEPPLFGRTAAETGKIWQAISEFTFYVEPAMDDFIRPIFMGKTDERALAMRAAVTTLQKELRAIELILAKAEWLVAGRLSAADIAIYPFIELLLRAAGKPAAQPFDLKLLPLSRGYPALAAWCERIRAIPGYDKTYPPHWKAA
jgi:glutathione S-transferase